MLDYNEIKPKKFIVFKDEPYEVISSAIARKQKQKPQNVTKLKNLITGNVVEHSFHASDRAHEADLEKQEIQYLYSNKGENWFCESDNRSKRFQLSDDILGDKLMFVKENSLVEALLFEENIIGIKLPIKVDLKVTEAPPNVKGNTAQGGDKKVTLETGAVVTTPMFIEEDETITVNTDTGEYIGRA